MNGVRFDEKSVDEKKANIKFIGFVILVIAAIVAVCAVSNHIQTVWGINKLKSQLQDKVWTNILDDEKGEYYVKLDFKEHKIEYKMGRVYGAYDKTMGVYYYDVISPTQIEVFNYDTIHDIEFYKGDMMTIYSSFISGEASEDWFYFKD